MPPDPDNTKMEELLKAYAKKRQDAAGAPLDVHPVSRRLLQEEVARVYPKATAGTGLPWHRMLFQFWPRIAFAMGIAVLLGGTLWMTNHHSDEPHPGSMAKNDLAPLRLQSAPMDYEQAPAPGKPAQLDKSLNRPINGRAPESKPTAASAPVSVATAPAPVDKLTEEYRITLADNAAKKAISEKESLGFQDTVKGQNPSRYYTSIPARSAAAAPTLAAPAPEAVEQKMAKAKTKLETDLPAIRADLTAKDAKGGKDLNQALDSGLLAEQTAKRSELDASLSFKESLAKTETTYRSPSSTPPGAAPMPAEPAAASRAALGVSGPPLALDYSTATTWTNTAYASAQNWNFQAGRDELGRARGFGGGLPNNLQKQLKDKVDADQDGALVGGFGNVGGDGRYGRLKAEPSRIAPNPNKGAEGSGLATANRPLGEVTSGSRGVAGAKKDAPLASQTGQTTAFFGTTTNSPTFGYSANGLASGPGGGGALTAIPATGNKVLDHFQMVQNGEILRIVDSDGSVYEGKLVLLTDSSIRLLERTNLHSYDGIAKAPTSQTEERLNRQATLSAGSASALPGETTQFKVSGVNRTLGQLVVVTGQLNQQPAVFHDTEEFGAVAGVAQRKLESNRAAAPQSGLPKSTFGRQTTNNLVRISGLVTIGGTNQIRLEAVPVSR
jgi:hypothetical protein